MGEEVPPDTDDSHPHCALSLHSGLSSVDRFPVSDGNTTGAAGKHRGSALQRNTAGLCSALTTICYFSPILDTRNETCAHADPGQDPGVISRVLSCGANPQLCDEWCSFCPFIKVRYFYFSGLNHIFYMGSPLRWLCWTLNQRAYSHDGHREAQTNHRQRPSGDDDCLLLGKGQIAFAAAPLWENQLFVS